MNTGEHKIRIDGKPALSLRTERTRTDEITPEAHWDTVSVAWRQPPDRLSLNLWLDACLPENDERTSYVARARSELRERGLESAAEEFATLAWANPDAEYPGAVQFESVCTKMFVDTDNARAIAYARRASYYGISDEGIGLELRDRVPATHHAREGRPTEHARRPTSLAGIRAKIGLAWRNERWHFPSRVALSSWIAKREDDPRLPGEAGIESLCQEAMSLLGVPAARTRTRVFGDQQCVLSKRADRTHTPEGAIGAVHQEDFAQATAWPGAQKYDSGTKNEPRWEAAYALLRAHGDRPEVEIAKLTRMLAATWMLGHCDLHRRNLGFTHVRTDGARRIRLAPMYDVSSAIDTCLDRRLAIGIARQHALAGIGRRQWLAHARQCGLDPEHTLALVQETVRDAPEAIAAAHDTVRTRDENRDQHAVDRRAEALINYARTRKRVFDEEGNQRSAKKAGKDETASTAPGASAQPAGGNGSGTRRGSSGSCALQDARGTREGAKLERPKVAGLRTCRARQRFSNLAQDLLNVLKQLRLGSRRCTAATESPASAATQTPHLPRRRPPRTSQAKKKSEPLS